MHNQPNGLCRINHQGLHISDRCVLFCGEKGHHVHIELRQGQLYMVDQKVEVDAVVQPNHIREEIEKSSISLVFFCTALTSTFTVKAHTQ